MKFVNFVSAKGFVQCKISNSTFDDCVRDGMQNAIPHLALGNSRQNFGYYNIVVSSYFIIHDYC